MIHCTEFAICALFIGVVSTASAEKHPFTVHDLVAMDRLGNLKVSPDGKTIAFELRQTDLEANKGRTQIWLVNVNGSDLRQLTTDAAGANSPCWAPDGKAIYFLSGRSGTSQIWKMAADGAETVQVTDMPLDAGNIIVSPDGERLAFTMDVFPGLDPRETRTSLDETAKRKASGRIYERLFVRHWDAWSEGTRSHLFAYTIKDRSLFDVMKAMDADSPSKPFGGPDEYAFTPDGKGIVFTAKDAGREEAWSTNYDLFYAPADGSQKPRNITSANLAWDTGPVFSPDGQTLAYRAMKRPGYENDRYRIVLRSWPEGTERTLAETWDRSPESLFWSPDGKTIYALAENFGQKALFAIDAVTGAIHTFLNDGTIRSLGFAGKRIVFGRDHLQSPVDLYTANSNGEGVKQITRVNEGRLDRILFGEPEQFSFAGWNGETVYGYLVKPVHFDPAKKYPVAFLIHGGPQGSFGNDFHYRWNPQVYAGAGYAAVMVDFHGSTGYGQAFTDAIRGDWGGKPLEDLKKGLETVLHKYPWMDGSRAAALGASYGGYMINWIAGNWPDGFRCLVCHDGNLDERFAYFDTEELWFPEWEHDGTPWDNPEGYEKHNPLSGVGRWKTPMLVIHGARDFRVTETQGLAAFNALQRRGIPSKLLYFPDENHWVLKPHNSILWHETVLGWLDRWCK
jgi:dipeptidyl aminopeptidase/acylaminoacyl peptidase